MSVDRSRMLPEKVFAYHLGSCLDYLFESRLTYLENDLSFDMTSYALYALEVSRGHTKASQSHQYLPQPLASWNHVALFFSQSYTSCENSWRVVSDGEIYLLVDFLWSLVSQNHEPLQAVLRQLLEMKPDPESAIIMQVVVRRAGPSLSV